jgi:peptide/nickel transport system substrate-binding protein
MKGRTDFDKIKQELAAAGYKGEKVIMLAPSTIPSLHAESQVAGDLLRRMGFNLDYQALEWGMVVARRASKEPPEKGGWNIFITNLTSFNNIFVPAQIGIRSGPNAWFGWPNAPKLEELRESWLDARTEEEQKRIVRDIQLQAWQDVPYVPLGLFFAPTAFDRTLTDIQMGWPVFHAVRRV